MRKLCTVAAMIIFFSICGCQAVAKKMAGIRKPRPENKESLYKVLLKYNLILPGW